MADEKISELTERTTVELTDIVPVVRGSEGADGTKKVTVATFLQAVYPVGSIYISTESTNPATTFGFGTWGAFGAGRVLVSVNASDSDFDASGKTGGSKTHTLTSGEMPSHTHVQDAHTHTQNAHTHVQDAHTHTQNSHNHVQDAHTHTQNSHTHTYKSQTATTGSETTYEHGAVDTSSAGTAEGGVTEAATAVNQNATATNQAATATNQNTTATNQNTTAVNQNTTATNQNTGGGGAHNNLQPYICVYMWKRTA